MTSIKFASKQEKTQYFTVDETIFSPLMIRNIAICEANLGRLYAPPIVAAYMLVNKLTCIAQQALLQCA